MAQLFCGDKRRETLSGKIEGADQVSVSPEQIVIPPELLLEWYLDMGADEAIIDTEVNWFAASEASAVPIIQAGNASGLVGATAVTQAATVAPQTRQQVLASDPESDVDEAVATLQSLEELRMALESLEGFQLKVTATNLVFGEGVESPDVMFIGDAPRADEDRQGRPFVGASGYLFDRMIRSIGLDRSKNAYITNILPWRPPGNREPTVTEIAICLPFIRRHIALVRPRVIVLVGEIAANIMLKQRQGIMRLRGRRFEFSDPGLEEPLPTVPMFHPAFLLRSTAYKALAWRDLLTIKKIFQ